jgi:hypothetical protein
MPSGRRRERARRTRKTQRLPRASPGIAMTSSRSVNQDPTSTRYPISKTAQKNAASISHRRNDRMTPCLTINQPNARGREQQSELQVPPHRRPGRRRASAGLALATTDSTLERFDKPFGVDEAQARQFPDTTHGVYELSTRQQVIDFGFARLVQEGDQMFTSPAVSFLLGHSRDTDRTEPSPGP